jgi:hypothetical protein
MITCQKFSEKRYIRVLGDNIFIPKELKNLNNLSHITVKDFKMFFNNV